MIRSPQNKSHGKGRFLEIGSEGLGHGRVFDAAANGVRDHADHLEPGFGRRAKADVLPERVAFTEYDLRQMVVEDDHFWRIGSVAVAKGAALQQANVHGLEIAGAHRSKGDRRLEAY